MDRYQEREIVRRHVREKQLTAAAAAAVLGMRRPGGEVLNIIRLLGNADPEVRKGAIRNLAGVGGSAAQAAIAKQAGDAEPGVRAEACRALGRLRAHAAKRQLYDLLGDRRYEVCLAAAEALAAMGDKHGLPYVVRLVCAGGIQQMPALRSFCQITGQKFPQNATGLAEAIRWIRFHEKDIMKF